MCNNLLNQIHNTGAQCTSCSQVQSSLFTKYTTGGSYCSQIDYCSQSNRVSKHPFRWCSPTGERRCGGSYCSQIHYWWELLFTNTLLVGVTVHKYTTGGSYCSQIHYSHYCSQLDAESNRVSKYPFRWCSPTDKRRCVGTYVASPSLQLSASSSGALSAS